MIIKNTCKILKCGIEQGWFLVRPIMTYKEVLKRVKDSKILQTIKGRRLPRLVTSCIKNCLLNHVTEGKING
jgi:hypothetical protein